MAMVRRGLLKLLFLASLAALCGYFSFGHPFLPHHLPPVFMMAAFWIFLRASSRIELIAAVGAYHFCAARSLIPGFAYMYQTGLIVGFIVLAATSITFATIIGLISFTKNPMLRLIILNALWCLPVFFVGWAAPVFAAGYFLPNTGWWGIAIILGLFFIGHKSGCVFKVLIMIIIFLCSFIKTENKENNIYEINTNIDNALIANRYEEFLKAYTVLSRLSYIQKDQNIAIAPENTFSCLDSTMLDMIKKYTVGNRIILYAGYETCGIDSRQVGVLRADGKGVDFIYQQRQPMPGAMYTPFSQRYAIHWLGKSTVDDHVRLGFFVCFESVVPWTYFQTMLDKPNVLLSFNSVYWDRTGQIHRIQDQMMYSMSRLFGVSYSGAWND